MQILTSHVLQVIKMNETGFWFWLSAIANICQLESYEMLLKQTDNDALLNYLQHQDNDYFKQIIKQNEEILNLLKDK